MYFVKFSMELVLEKREKRLFEMGKIVVTRGLLGLMEKDEGFVIFVRESLEKHSKGIWGDLSSSDKFDNELSLDQGFRLLSAYTQENFPRIWIITEGDRIATTVPFPEEY